MQPATEQIDLIPFVVPSYVERVRRLVAKFEAQLAKDPDDRYARLCLEGWRRELEKVEEGRY